MVIAAEPPQHWFANSLPKQLTSHSPVPQCANTHPFAVVGDQASTPATEGPKLGRRAARAGGGWRKGGDMSGCWARRCWWWAVRVLGVGWRGGGAGWRR